jgi:A/G-specific adenine glycosylase
MTDELPSLRRALLAWHRPHGLHAPWRASGDAYHVLVAAVMAQQTQMSRVLLKFDEFIAAFPTVEALARAPAAEVLRRWEGLGYNLRALRLHRAAKLIVRRGGFPRTAGAGWIEGRGVHGGDHACSLREPAPRSTRTPPRAARLPATSTRAQRSALLPRRGAVARVPGRWNQAIMDLGGVVCAGTAPCCAGLP